MTLQLLFSQDLVIASAFRSWNLDV